MGGKKYLCFSILFHNTQLLALIVIKMWENWSSALEGGGNSNRFPIQTRIFSKERVGEGAPFHLPPVSYTHLTLPTNREV